MNITVLFKEKPSQSNLSAPQSFKEKFAEFRKTHRMKNVQVGEALKELGAYPNERTAANMYGFFTRGERKFPSEKIEFLARACGVLPEVIHELNDMLTDGCPSEQASPTGMNSVNLDSNLDVREQLENFPENLRTLGEFLLWIEFNSKLERIQIARGE